MTERCGRPYRRILIACEVGVLAGAVALIGPGVAVPVASRIIGPLNSYVPSADVVLAVSVPGAVLMSVSGVLHGVFAGLTGRRET